MVAAAGGRGPLRRHRRLVGHHGRHPDRRRPFDTSYLHLSSLAGAARATACRAGERVGAVGTTGQRSAAAPHLHFGVRDAGTRHGYHDPLAFLPPPRAAGARPEPPPPAPVAAPQPAARRPLPPAPARARPRRRPPPALPAPCRARAPAPAAPGMRPPRSPARSAARAVSAAGAPSRNAVPRSPARSRTGAATPHRAGTAGRRSSPAAGHLRCRRRPPAATNSRHRRARPRLGARLRRPARWPPPCSASGTSPTRRGRGRIAGAQPRGSRGPRVASIVRCRTTSPRRSTTSTASRTSATRTRRSPPTSSPATCASAARTSSSSRAPTSTASRWRRRPSARASRRASWATATPSGSRSSRAAQRHERLLHPHDRPASTWRRSPRSSSASTTTATSTPGTYEGWYCPRCADFKTESELEDGNRCPIHKIVLEREKEDNWFFRLSTFQEPLEQLYADRPGLRDAREPLQRGARRSSRAACSDVSLSRARLKWGVPVPWDDVAGLLRLDRRAPQLLHGALATRAPGEDLTEQVLAGRRPPDRQGHPQVPRRDLAGDADGGRDRGAASRSPSTATCCWASTRCRSRSAT